jgi:P-type Mg2+ transporter
VLGVAVKTVAGATRFSHDEERDMTFLGCLVLDDPPKDGIADTVQELKSLGVKLIVITGDNRLVAANLAQRIGLNPEHVLAGPELHGISDEALKAKIRHVQVFAEVEPNHKERIILALRKAGHVVGFLGDGINDASALHAADVGISVDSAVDVAKEAAHFVLLRHDLNVLIQGVREGRRTFANTLKYVFMATSANFGNMFSMAGASLFLPFLPLLPKQILLTNLLTDIPEMAIATDRVDAALVERPERWDLGFIRRFMIVFGLLSSVFDYLTFGVLLHLDADAATFRTGWFLESVVSASMIVLVIRTRQPFFRSQPSRPLVAATVLVWCLVVALAYVPMAGVLGFTPLPPIMLAWLTGILLLYVLAAEGAKYWFYRAGRRSGAGLAS